MVLAETAPEDYTSWPDFLAAGEGVPSSAVREREAAIAPSDPSDIIYTSGTTGAPKGAVITHAQTLRAYEIWSDLAGLREGDRYLIVNPFFHTFGYKAGIIACDRVEGPRREGDGDAATGSVSGGKSGASVMALL
ncbi:2-succinylbenzoate--CoA ligase [Streptomyces microflavus]